MDTDTFDLRNEKGEAAFYVLIFVCLFFASDIVIYLFFRPYIWQTFEIGSSYSQTFTMITSHNTTLIS